MKKDRIFLIDTGGSNWLGGSYYIRNIASALDFLPRDARERFEFNCVTGQSGDLPSGGACQWIRVARPNPAERPLVKKVGSRVSQFTGICDPITHQMLKGMRPDFAYPCATGPAERVGYRSAHWIADLQSQKLPESNPPEYRTSNRIYLSNIARDAQTVVLSSHASEADCHEIFPQSKPKTFVLNFRAATLLPEISTPPLDVAPNYHIPEKYFVVCNQFWKHKNHLRVFEAVGKLKARGVNVHGVCTGRLFDERDPGFSDMILRAIWQNGVASSVSLLGALPRPEMLSLMRRAVAVVQPSLFEGWNTSVEEAHCLGLPLVLSDIPVHREQAPAGATFFDPTSADQLADALQTVWETHQADWRPEREAAAAASYRRKVVQFGERFLELVARQG